MTQPQARATQEVTVRISIWFNERQYEYVVPSGVPYEEAYTVALEMAAIIKKMQEENRQQQETEQPKESDEQK